MSASRDSQRKNSKTTKEAKTVSPLCRIHIHLVALAALLGLAALPASASAAAPHWKLDTAVGPTHLISGGAPGVNQVLRVVITNTGGAPAACTEAAFEEEKERFEAEPSRNPSPQCPEDSPATNPITLEDNLPAGLSVRLDSKGLLLEAEDEGKGQLDCSVGPPVTCTGDTSYPIYSGGRTFFYVPVTVEPGLDGATLTNEVSVSGGGAAVVAATQQVHVSSEPAPPGFQSTYFGLFDDAGEPLAEAGAHPYDMQVGFELNTVVPPGGHEAPAGAPKDVTTTLPRGLVVNPQATPVLCEEAELETGHCPDASAIGLADVTLDGIGSNSTPGPELTAPLYNMVAPPGAPAELAFEPVGLGVFIHLLGRVDTEGAYALGTNTFNTPQLGIPSGITVDLWGDPSDPSHDHRRGNCAFSLRVVANTACPVAQTDVPFLSMPSACSGPLSMGFEVAPWEDRTNPFSGSAETKDTDGNPIGVTGCESLDFKPTLNARPTTNVADSPSGLEVDLNVPQANSLGTKATSTLKKAEVTLPEGLVVNPSAANGLGACSPAQIGMLTPVGQANARFSSDPDSCPDAAKVGTVEVDTPLLEDPLLGTVYIAQPHANPFNSLLALYIAVADPKTGVAIKLAGQVSPDPNTGRITATFDENPELPFEDFKLKFFGGAGGTLRTPPTCGEYATDSTLSPWSGTAPVASHDSYAISQAPGGGPCPTADSQRPNSPSFDAGTVSPVAGAYSPFVLHLNREDGSQNISALNVTTPPGFTGRLAGIPYCPDSALAAATAKTGREEEAAPSCPAASALGTVTAGAGAGPAPYYAKGTAYLTGPYKGAPLSMAILTPATAGPFDLGTIVVRVALRLDPATGQIDAISDPIPQILQGIPLDLRSVTLRLDRERFTRTGTSCNPFAVSGAIASPLGTSALVSSRYQLGECSSLPFKPKLSIRLTGPTNRGAHPALRGTLTMPEGGANLASAQIALPHSEFLDQAHIGTVCTRVQFAAGAGNGAECPPASIYGHATAKSPLVDYTVEGNVFLRSSSHELPDLVLALHGPPSQPIAVETAARTDSIHGGIRSTFEAAPDLPISEVVLSMAGGKKGLLQNSTNICQGTHRANAKLIGQNSKALTLRPALTNPKCKGQGSKRGKKAKGKGHGAKRAAAR